MMPINKEFVYPAAASVCAVIGSVFDIKSRRVPNFLTGPAILAGLMLHLLLDSWYGLGDSALSGFVGFAVFLIFYLAGGMGAGDVKLITAVGCLAGTHYIAFLLAYTAIAGGVMGLVLAVVRGRLKETLLSVFTMMAHHRREGLTPHPEINVLNERKLRLPYALAITAGCALTFCIQGVQR
jgi:prepilin peptidase CpaA